MDKELTPGQRFLRLLRIEKETQLRNAEILVANYRWSLETYAHALPEIRNRHALIDFYEAEIRYLKEELGIGGAENEEFLTEANVSESPQKFTGITCTTV